MEGMKSYWLIALIVMSAAIGAAQTAPPDPSSISEIFNSELAGQTALASSATLSYTVAHFPYGGGLTTRIALTNSGSTSATVKFTFFDHTGLSTSVPLEGLGPKSTETVTVGANQTQVIGSELSQRTAAGQVAWATMTSSAPLNVFSLFDFGPPSTPQTITWAVGAQSTAPSKSFRFPVSIGGPVNYDAGMALSNPNGTPTVVTVKVMKSDGTQLGSFTENLGKNAQTVFLLSSQAGLNFGSTPQTPFNGSVAVCAPQAVGLVALGAEGSGGLFSISVTTDPCP
jgi:hypothetical protein